ncbi:MAG: hypothetical protein HQL46_02490 [Gammaproteobacteria bacterium]|nr:hypothetical protein [Gammaproteobacteria bacterium]
MTKSVSQNNQQHEFLSQDHERINECIHDVLTNYFADLDNHYPGDLYQLVLAEVEKPLLETVMAHTSQNQTLSSQILGLSRSTLRKKLKQYQLD